MATKIDIEENEPEENPLETYANGRSSEKDLFDFGVVHTGSTLLDLHLTGDRRNGGGLPGGIIVEVFGPSSSGKTAIITEVAAHVQLMGGEVMFCDPEGRLDKHYARIYGFELSKENYHRPDTVNEWIDLILKWKPKDPDKINMVAADSLAALSTEMEMEDEDKMGMKRAKDFSAGMRKVARIIANRGWLVVCSNQERHGGTPGGKAIPYYSSCRLRVYPDPNGKYITLKKKIDVKGDGKEVEIEKTIGIKSEVSIVKSTIGKPYGRVPLSIIFNKGIDTVRDELQWTKSLLGASKYNCVEKEFAWMSKALPYIEENNLEPKLREMTIRIFNQIEDSFRDVKYKEKVRYFD